MEQKKSIKTYCIIPNYLVTSELIKLAENTLKSFRKSDPEAILISVDDGSPIGQNVLIYNSDYYLKNEKNSGFAPTCNKGFRWIFENEPDDCYIICANNDIEVNKRVIPALKEPFELYPDVAITGIISTMEKQWEGKPLEDAHVDQMVGGGLLLDRMMDGGLWMSKKSILQKIGIFDEQFIRGGYEDVDLFLRARDTYGMQIIMSGHAVYWHKQGATRWNCENNGFVNNFGIESRSIENDNLKKFINKWGKKYNPHLHQLWRGEPIRTSSST